MSHTVESGVKAAPKTARDPVCGMEFDEATGKFPTEYKDARFYFCSFACQSEFEKNPEKYSVIVAPLKVRDIMTPEVETVGSDTSLFEAAKRMASNGTRPLGTIALVSILLVALVFLLAYYQYSNLPMIPSSQISASSLALQELQNEIVDAATLKGDHAYSPSPIKLVIGSNNSVVFRNSDSVSGGVSHTAADKGGSFNTGAL